MKTRVILMGLLIASVLLASACGGAQPPAPQATEAPEVVEPTEAEPTEAEPVVSEGSDVTGTVKFAFPGEDIELKMRPVIIEMFNAKYPNIKVEAYPVSPDGYDTQIMADIAAGTPPDIFVSGDVHVGRLISSKTAEDLTPYFEKDPDLKESMFYPSVLDYFRGPDGHVYMMPDTYDVERIYFNKALFEAAGVELPQDGWTQEDFLNAAKAITKGEGVDKTYGFFADGWWPIWMTFVWGNGGSLFSEDGTTCVLTEPAAVEALDYYANLIREGYSPSPQELEGLGMEGWDLFVTGRVGMIMSGGWEIPAFEEETDFEWGMVTLPKGKQDATMLHLTNYVMASSSKNKEAAWQFLKFLASPEVYNLEAAEYGWGVPPRQDVAEAFVANPPEGTSEMNLLNVQVGSQSAPYGTLPTKVLNFIEIRDDAIYPSLDQLWAGELSAEEAAAQACAIAPEAFK